MEERPGQKREKVIRTPDQRLRVFISSTLKELAEEREAVRQSVLKLRLVPIMFEAGARPHPAGDLYRAYLAQSHVFIGIYWQSYGWVGPGMEISGLEDEYVRSAGLPRLIYIKAPAPEREPGLERLLGRIQSDNTTSYRRFGSTAELGELVENDLALMLTESYETASQTPAEQITPRPLTNLLFPRNPLLGREAEMKTLMGWLTQEDVGLVTLTGAGGAGKSRLALEAALKLREDFEDGAFLVRLSPISDPRRVIPAIAETLGLHESAQSVPVDEILIRFLQNKHVLLLLDNFEQVLPAAPEVARLLEACPRLKLLITSRASLRLRGEKELLVQPLAVPQKGETDRLRLSQYPSVQLFTQRAQAIRPDFQMTNENAADIAEIIHRLDGLPLAIELAAARSRLLHPQELLARLSHSFDILSGGTRDLPERQQTLRGAIDWSYNLLSDPARALFRRLSVFSGNLSLEAAEAVCNLDDDLGPTVFEEIETLVDYSMLFPVEGLEDHQRFAMLGSIREYAAERLVESGEVERVRRLHAEYFARFAQDVEPRIRTAERARWRAILEQEMDNIRSALEWGLVDPVGLATGQEITNTLSYFWALCGHLSEGNQLAEKFLAQAGEDTPPVLHTGLLTLYGATSLVQGRSEVAKSALEEALQLSRQCGNQPCLGNALLWNGSRLLASGEPAAAAAQFEEALDVFHKIGDDWSAVLASLWLSNALNLQGDKERAAGLFEQTLTMARRQGDPWCLVTPLADVAQAAFSAGDLQKAESTLLEIEYLSRRGGDQWALARTLNSLAQIDLARRDSPAAIQRIREALGVGRDNGYLKALTFTLLETAAVILLRHLDPGADENVRAADLRTAAFLCGATKPLADNPTVLERGLGTRENYGSMLDQVHSAIEADIWDPAFAAGASIPLEEALEMAAQELAEEQP